jgi:hypothetical protein
MLVSETVRGTTGHELPSRGPMLMFKEPGKIQLSRLSPSYLQNEAKRASYDQKMQQKSKVFLKGFL